ncbi:Retrovirus-related Pol polyprotein from transposon TNT 1-94 [Araneus ventricosus]|uniref:Retrovirus-related Pol polyprotein from transposon TNT 1-94 n=1 Tax=Araneus ventricosus TaxID=182803 RepID=A0A4Y2T0F1_ARAVE|nr:Retrovirus-related Pol polyprotein from transposon TNT 1-94 [Araneus ventricosus]
MKQDLKRTETVFLSNASTSRKSSAVPGDASGNKWYEKEDGKVFVKQNKTTESSAKKIGPCFLCKKYGHLKGVKIAGDLGIFVGEYGFSYDQEINTDSRFNPSVKELVNKGLGRKIVSVKTDGGLEFCNRDLDNFLEQQGINHEETNPYTPGQNGVTERYNLTALHGVKALLKSNGVAQKFLGEVLLCFTYTWNRVCHKDGNKTPFETYSGKKLSVSHLKHLGCLAYVGVPKQIRKKLDMRAKLGINVGYCVAYKGLSDMVER